MRLRWLSLCCLLSGCLVGPNYHPPNPIIPEGWECACSTMEVPIAWWQEFHDPLLDRYIELAADYNFDVLKATANIFEARALRTIAASSLFPQLNGNFTATRMYFSKNGPVFNFSSGQTSNVSPGFPFEVQVPQVQNVFTALIDASWEIDLFGGIRRGVEAACAGIGSAIEQRNGVLTAVFADIGMSYIDLRSAQQKGKLIEENIQLLEDEAALTRLQWEKGLIDRLNVETIEAQLADLKATLPPVLAQIYQNIYALSILTGALPETLVEELLPIQPLPHPPASIMCGLRSELLRRRPDVRQAERDMAAATANIGVAVASFFPTFSLTGTLGLQSVQFRRLFQLPSNTWTIGNSTTLPIFQGGNLMGNLRLTEAEAVAAAFSYQQTVLTALEEAESALVAYRQDEESVCHREAALDRYARVDHLTATQFKKGLVDLTNVLDSGRQLITAKQDLLDSETALLLDLIKLYQALGGGWELFSL